MHRLLASVLQRASYNISCRNGFSSSIAAAAWSRLLRRGVSTFLVLGERCNGLGTFATVSVPFHKHHSVGHVQYN
jgi:hypothetical protein